MDCITNFGLSESTLDKLNKHDEETNTKPFEVYTMELMSDEDTPTSIKEALICKDSEYWRKSAISEINNFLKRKSWRFVRKLWVQFLKVQGVCNKRGWIELESK